MRSVHEPGSDGKQLVDRWRPAVWWRGGGQVGTMFLVVGLELLFLALQRGGLALLLVWPASSFLGVAAIYFFRHPQGFGKQPTGRLSWPRTLILLPFLLAVWSVWHLVRRVSHEPAANQVGEGIWVGRRLLRHELPPQIDLVVDLTCEFPEPLPFPAGPNYLSFPILDAGAPEPQELLDLTLKLAEQPGSLLIHCAQGHGRSGMVAAIVLVLRRAAGDLDQAIEQIRAQRPGVRLKPIQYQCAAAALELWRQRAVTPA